MAIYLENLKQFEGQTVKVNIGHKIYGDQQLKIRRFQPLCAEGKVGFVVEGREVFLFLDEIKNMEAYENVFKIIGEIRSITIELI